MGLDQYMYAKPHANSPSESSREIAYLRKHPAFHGWMERLAEKKGLVNDPYQFNGVELELTREDIDQLEQDIVNGRLPATSGFFFGGDSSEHYKKQDLEFVRNARAELFCGLKIFYNSSW